MDINLKRIVLRNFKGAKSLEVDFGDTTAIYGRNATKKTTIFDGFLWLLFGKDSQNKADFEIKPLDGDGNPAHNLEHSVEALLTVGDQPVTLKKTHQEKYTRKRGSAAAEFVGHTTDYWYNDVPCKESEYRERIRGIVDEKIFRLLTDPRYFNEVLHWEDRRKILLEVCGNLSDQDVIDSDSSLAGLTALLNGNKIEDLKKILAAKRKAINEQLQKIPTRIDEATRSITEVVPWLNEIPATIEALEKSKADLESRLVDLRNGGAISAKRIELQKIEAEIQEKKNAFEEGKSARIAPLNKELNDLLDTAGATRRRVKDLEDALLHRKSALSSKEKSRERLLQEWHAADAREFAGNTHCPTCKQALPADQVDAARMSFNAAKADELASIEARGMEIKKDIETLHARIAEIEKELASIGQPAAGSIEKQDSDIREQIAAIRAEQPDLSALIEKKNAAIAALDDIAQAEQGPINKAQAEIAEIRTEINTLLEEIRKADANKTIALRVEELKAQEKSLSKSFEELEANLFLVENFTRAKVALLDERINSKFSLARFKLFEDQINGGLQEVCVTTLKGVPYSSINNAGRIQVGMDIIRTLQAHYGLSAPIWIDNRESIVDLPDSNGQVISLVVSEQDKALRIETEGKTTTKTMKKAGGM